LSFFFDCDIVSRVASFCRFIAVTRPLSYARHKNSHRVFVMLGLTWIVSVAVSSPIVLGANYTERRNQHPGVCTFYNSDFLIYSSMASFYVPCIAMIVLYWRVFRAIRRRERKTAVQASTAAAPLLDCQAQPTTHDNGGPHTTCGADDGGGGGSSAQSNTKAQLHPSPLNLPPPPPPPPVPPSQPTTHCLYAVEEDGAIGVCSSLIGDTVDRPAVDRLEGRQCSTIDRKIDNSVQRIEESTPVAETEYGRMGLAKDGIGKAVTAGSTAATAAARPQPLPILLVPSCESHATYNTTDGVLEMLPTPFLPTTTQVCSGAELD
jgi:hypothetical protein